LKRVQQKFVEFVGGEIGNGSNIDTEEADVGWESLGFRRQTETTVEQFAELKHPPRNRYHWVSSALLLLLCLGSPISFSAIAAFDLRSNSGPPFFLRRPFLFFRHRNDYHTPFPTHFSLVRWISHFFFQTTKKCTRPFDVSLHFRFFLPVSIRPSKTRSTRYSLSM
jgi:hypothetical protein